MRYHLGFAICTAAACACSSGANAPAAKGNPGGGVAGDASPGQSDDANTDTWTNYARDTFAMYCVPCHNATDSVGRDYSIQANVEREKLVIRCGVAASQDPAWGCAASPTARQFPIGNGPKPTDPERARIVAWISAGAP